MTAGQGRWVRRPQGRLVGGVLAALALALAAVAVTWGGGAPAAADDGCPDEWVDEYGNCNPEVEIPVEEPGVPGGDPTTSVTPDADGPTTPTTLDPNRCETHVYDEEGQAIYRGVFPEAPEDAVFVYEVCYVDGNPILGPYVPEWIVPSEVGEATATLVTPEQAAQTLWAQVEDTLLVPSVDTWPPAGARSVVGLPVFFAVDNWQGPQHVSDCVAGVCLSMDATPSLSLIHGEQGSTTTVPCEDGGTSYDEDGPPAATQAEADLACAHTYEHRTGVPGQPDPWQAQLRITWEITWSGGGQSGTIPPFTLDSAPIQIAVSDVTTVVSEGG